MGEVGCFTSRLLKKRFARPISSMFAMATRVSTGYSPRYKRGIYYSFASSSALQTDSSHRSQDLGDANEIVGGGGQYEERFDQRPSAMACLTKTTDGLDPAERLL